jgi:hypothetical protein
MGTDIQRTSKEFSPSRFWDWLDTGFGRFFERFEPLATSSESRIRVEGTVGNGGPVQLSEAAPRVGNRLGQRPGWLPQIFDHVVKVSHGNHVKRIWPPAAIS